MPNWYKETFSVGGVMKTWGSSPTQPMRKQDVNIELTFVDAPHTMTGTYPTVSFFSQMKASPDLFPVW